ncbi:MAG: energy transducer TonB [Alphaproteobacteria bacterium]|nr:energy transducer TonB [Alphaproteobacteria bacterium]
MRHERKEGLIISGFLHLLMLLLMIFGLPSWLSPEQPPEPQAISVEILPITEVSNIKPSEKPPAPDEKKDAPPEPEKPKPPTPPVKMSEPPPPPKEELAPPKDEKKPAEVKKEEPKKEEPKNKPKDEDLAAILKAVKNTVTKEQEKEKPKDEKKKPDTSSQAQSRSTNYDASMPLSMSEKDALRSQFAKCWSVPAGAKDAHELSVLVEIEIALDGTVTKVELAPSSKARYSSDAFYRAAADSAIRAVRQCSPLKDLPPDKYNTWHNTEVNFDPREMLF